LPDPGAQRLSEAVRAWTASFGTYAGLPAIGRDELAQSLEAAHVGYDQLKVIARWIDTKGRELAAWAGNQLGLPNEHGQLAALLDSARVQSREVLANLESSQPDASQPATRRQAQERIWIETLNARLGTANPEDTATIRQALARGKWTTAANLVLERLSSSAHPLAGLDRTTSGVRSDAPELMAMGVLFNSNLLPNRASQSKPFPETPSFTGSPAELARLEHAKASVSFVQTLIVGLLFVLVIYRLFEPDWLGTFTQGLGILAWAFFVDLTTDSMLPLLRKAVPANG
ncbi:MAG: hypothetical protein Q8N51_20625, partial [Gammaproteobacteria bacterium]|nr:hypothetical protein [Gammaproteobacteria bacterium]